MTREEIVNSMSLQDAIQVFKDTNAYGTMDIAKTVILKALEQKPCEYYDADNKTCRKSEVPVTPQPMWIPVSERLPDIEYSFSDGGYDGEPSYDAFESERVLVSYISNESKKIKMCVSRFSVWKFKDGTKEESWDSVDFDYEKTNTYNFITDYEKEGGKVIAWMPLPEPYKAEGCEE